MARSKGSKTANPASAAPVSGPDNQLELLKSKLRRKYSLLRDKVLDQPDRESLLLFVCGALGMTRKELDWVLKDL